MSAVPYLSLGALDTSVAVEDGLWRAFSQTLAEVVDVMTLAVRAKAAHQEHVLVGEVLPEVVELDVIHCCEVSSVKGDLVGVGVDDKATETVDPGPQLVN